MRHRIHFILSPSLLLSPILAQPSIIFFDEIDGLAPVRSVKQDQIHASVVSTLLALMDGLDSRGQVTVRSFLLSGIVRRFIVCLFVVAIVRPTTVRRTPPWC